MRDRRHRCDWPKTVTAPLSGYMIARAGYLRGLPPAKEATSVDEWGALGAATEEFEKPVGDANDA